MATLIRIGLIGIDFNENALKTFCHLIFEPFTANNNNNSIADSKLMRMIMDAATLTVVAASIGWVGKNVVKENFSSAPSSNVMNYAKFTVVMADSITLKQYLEDQKIIQTS